MTKRPDDDLVLLAGVIAWSGAVAPFGDQRSAIRERCFDRQQVNWTDP